MSCDDGLQIICIIYVDQSAKIGPAQPPKLVFLQETAAKLVAAKRTCSNICQITDHGAKGIEGLDMNI